MDVKQLLEDLRGMLVDKDNGEMNAPWEQVPEKYQDDFLNWCSQVKHESWDGIEETGWMIYAHEYLAFLISNSILEIQEIKQEVIDRITGK